MTTGTAAGDSYTVSPILGSASIKETRSVVFILRSRLPKPLGTEKLLCHEKGASYRELGIRARNISFWLARMNCRSPRIGEGNLVQTRDGFRHTLIAHHWYSSCGH